MSVLIYHNIENKASLVGLGFTEFLRNSFKTYSKISFTVITFVLAIPLFLVAIVLLPFYYIIAVLALQYSVQQSHKLAFNFDKQVKTLEFKEVKELYKNIHLSVEILNEIVLDNEFMSITLLKPITKRILKLHKLLSIINRDIEDVLYVKIDIPFTEKEIQECKEMEEFFGDEELYLEDTFNELKQQRKNVAI